MSTLYNKISGSTAYQQIRPFVPSGDEQLKIKLQKSVTTQSKMVSDVEQADFYVKNAQSRSKRFAKVTDLSVVEDDVSITTTNKKINNGKLPKRNAED